MNEVYYVVTSFSNGVREYYSNLGKVTRYFPTTRLFNNTEETTAALDYLSDDLSMDWEVRQIKVCME